MFNDYVSEIQRSIGYFSSVNRNAKIKKLIGVGNGFKLAGLQKFLQQNLTQFEVERLSGYKGLVGDNVLNAALFEENLLSFAVPYGLALQARKAHQGQNEPVAAGNRHRPEDPREKTLGHRRGGSFALGRVHLRGGLRQCGEIRQ